MKRLGFIVLLPTSLLLLSGCGTKVDDTLISSGTVQGFTSSYTVGNSPVFQKALYGTVISDSTKNILTNRVGILDSINCQPGDHVYKDTIIAKIQANPDDLTYQNSTIQLSTLQEQLANLTTIFSMTEDTLVLQKNILQDQYDNNRQLLENLDKSQGYSASNMEYQEQLLQQQSQYLQDAKDIDLDKMKSSISTAYKQYLVMIKDALKKVDDVFGIDNTTNNDAYEQNISSKNPDLKTQVANQYHILKDSISDAMTADEFSRYLSDMSDFMGLAASSINASTSSTALPQSSNQGISIDGLYATYTTLSTTFMGSKSAFDTLSASYDSVKNTYNNQISTVDINSNNLQENTSQSAALQLENQKASLQLAQKTISHQLASADDSAQLQLATLKNQILTMNQNIAVLSNSLEGEILYAGVDGIVKMRTLGEDNKVAPNTLLCQITPMDLSNASIQIFSYQRLSLGSKVAISDQQGIFLGTGTVLYEYPYKDPATQNFIYEIPVVGFPLKENARVMITIAESADKNDIWIPLQYISPRLEGNLVRRKVGTTIQEVYVTLGNIDDSYVQVLSGLTLGDEIVQ